MDSRNFTANAQFLRQTSETFLGMSLGPRGMLWAIMAHFGPPGTPRKSSLSKKRPKEDERVGRGHFHERGNESPAQCGRFGANGSSLARFVPEIWQFEKKGLV